MEESDCRAAIEAVLFSCGDAVPVSRLAKALEIGEEEARAYADDLADEYSARKSGLLISRLDGAYQMSSDPVFAPSVRRALEIRKNAPLSQAAMETLSLVAYRQPVTRAFVEQVRGVDCGAVLQGLEAKGLIEETGRLDLPGRPLTYGTTPRFLLCFGLRSLKDLPPLPGDGEATPNSEEASGFGETEPEETGGNRDGSSPPTEGEP